MHAATGRPAQAQHRVELACPLGHVAQAVVGGLGPDVASCEVAQVLDVAVAVVADADGDGVVGERDTHGHAAGHPAGKHET